MGLDGTRREDLVLVHIPDTVGCQAEEDHHEYQVDPGEKFGTAEVEKCGGQHEDSDGDHVLVERQDIEIGSVLCKLGDISVIGASFDY